MSKQGAKKRGMKVFRSACVQALHGEPGFRRAARQARVWVDIGLPAGSRHLTYKCFSRSTGRELLTYCTRTGVVRVPGFRTLAKAASPWHALAMASGLEAGKPVAEALAVRPSPAQSGQAA